MKILSLCDRKIIFQILTLEIVTCLNVINLNYKTMDLYNKPLIYLSKFNYAQFT